MLRCEAILETKCLSISYALTNTVGETIYVFDQIPFGRSGPEGFEVGFDSSLAWTSVQQDNSVLVLHGNVAPPPSPPCPPFERVLTLATQVRGGEMIERTVVLPRPIAERSPYVGPGHPDGQPGTRPPLDATRTSTIRLAVEFVRRKHARRRKHPIHKAGWEAIGYPVERQEVSIDLASPVTVNHYLQPIERFS